MQEPVNESNDVKHPLQSEWTLWYLKKKKEKINKKGFYN